MMILVHSINKYGMNKLFSYSTFVQKWGNAKRISPEAKIINILHL
jgi:hypothetical protein